jgi:hypothetical protein
MAELPKIVLTAPDRIWLQVCPEDDGCSDSAFGEIERVAEITWRADSIGGVQVEYIRADLVAPSSPSAPIDSSPAYSKPTGEDYEKAIAEAENDICIAVDGWRMAIESLKVRAKALASQRAQAEGSP